ncbi:bifunctional phosphopantothenoylcysteine decarboxylase/phosphopantothenate--cysteine ligase CoaBC [Marinagarivorans cellulosilyticus]|uniref:Coenzyme A biosynthesis bifunctional protein CoaBC n=1 Tax=Marinagarivorans cellulosilyticus TaxID=2721545 RepID=A0AAN2BIZ5_9GAMM|nr:bifunctional phosphopantothenoylcysteine decarboxylase/phosphopantothenate--cysteine ligase CoaBC [Marinagarivorans cellulosilyticus]BCD96437.1 phosphopantothenoylcysteine decarboxylase / phosphopantothenate---cysteine ligase [Marinagarivorans cellulosilyticus]
MSNLHNKNILLGITGGIAAYKCAELTRLLKKQGANIQVVMTPAAEAFVTPMTLQAVSGNPVRTHLLDTTAEAGMGHIELARWADLILIAPATADCIARLAHGFANDLLTTVCLATKAPIALAPAMNQAMWSNLVTQANVAKIALYPHFVIWGPGEGEQACGDTGVGRMLEPNEITQHAIELITEQEQLPQTQPKALHGKRIVITAGPTREAIDPVRYLSNESSGKMGYALAQAALNAGAQVTLISGPTQLLPPAGATVTHVISALEMHAASLEAAKDADIFIGAAAVADFRPSQYAAQKIKKGTEQHMHIALTKNPDIIADVAKLTPRPWLVGFAAETRDLIGYATQKLQRKKLDMIIANDVSDKNIGFNSDSNAVTVLSQKAQSTEVSSITLAVDTKDKIAEQLLKVIAKASQNEPLISTSL